MALAFQQRPVDKNGGTKALPDALYATITSVTLDASYVAGGVALTPANFGFSPGGQVVFGTLNIRTNTATGPGDGVLDCTSPSAPKLKLQNAAGTAELANGAASGAVVDILAYGF